MTTPEKQKTIAVVGNYRGVEVRVEGFKNLLFVATIGTQKFSGPSWESITTKLDPAIGFEARDVILEIHNPEDRNNLIIQTVRIVGREKSNYGFKFVTDKGEVLRNRTTYDPEARSLIEERRVLSDACSKMTTEYHDKIDAINEKLNPLIVCAERAGE